MYLSLSPLPFRFIDRGEFGEVYQGTAVDILGQGTGPTPVAVKKMRKGSTAEEQEVPVGSSSNEVIIFCLYSLSSFLSITVTSIIKTLLRC